jgi:hypothetical protein
MSLCLERCFSVEEVLEIFARWKHCEWDALRSHDLKSGFVGKKTH